MNIENIIVQENLKDCPRLSSISSVTLGRTQPNHANPTTELS